MEENEAFSVAERFLLAVYANDMIACANISCLIAERNVNELSNILDSVIEFANKIKENLKK